MISENFIGKHCIVRTYSAGVFAGTLSKAEDDRCVLSNARRIWSWSGASSLSELAMYGTSDPDNCKFPCSVTEILLYGVIEIIPTTAEAEKSIKEVLEWKQR